MQRLEIIIVSFLAIYVLLEIIKLCLFGKIARQLKQKDPLEGRKLEKVYETPTTPHEVPRQQQFVPPAISHEVPVSRQQFISPMGNYSHYQHRRW